MQRTHPIPPPHSSGSCPRSVAGILLFLFVRCFVPLVVFKAREALLLVPLLFLQLVPAIRTLKWIAIATSKFALLHATH